MAKKRESDLSTEEKIIEAARKVFTQKGYAATRTRDIAEEAGINLALLNYYFRSKEKLFEKVMFEKVHKLFGAIAPVLNDENSDLTEKIEKIVENYINMLVMNPDLPLFVLSEIKNNSEQFGDKFNVGKLMLESVFASQIRERRPDISPLHIIMSVLGLVLFPFIGRPVLRAIGAVDEASFMGLMEERKKLVPHWVAAILNS